MESLDRRIIVLRPGEVAGSAVIRHGADDPAKESSEELISGHDVFLYVANGYGTYQTNGRVGILQPNTLVATTAGSFSCELRGDREMYVLAVREPARSPDDPKLFNPSLERRFTGFEARQWRERMAGFADKADAGRFDADDLRQVRHAVAPYVWKSERYGARATLQELFMSIWSRLAEPLTLERLAVGVGYTANYLNDLSRVHTGRPLGGWIADMRMARARVALEHTELPIAEIGAACGYDDPAYFSRAFRRAHGVPPATWRISTRPADSRYVDVTVPLDIMHEIEAARHAPQPTYSFAS